MSCKALVFTLMALHKVDKFDSGSREDNMNPGCCGDTKRSLGSQLA